MDYINFLCSRSSFGYLQVGWAFFSKALCVLGVGATHNMLLQSRQKRIRSELSSSSASSISSPASDKGAWGEESYSVGLRRGSSGDEGTILIIDTRDISVVYRQVEKRLRGRVQLHDRGRKGGGIRKKGRTNLSCRCRYHSFYSARA